MNSPFSFLRASPERAKPRTEGVTEIRGPYYGVMGKRYLADVLETMGEHVDILKFAGGSFALMPAKALHELIELCHAHQVRVSTGGFIERALVQGPGAVDRYLAACRELNFDVIEISSGFLSISPEDLLRLARRIQELGFQVKPEVGIQFGAGGATPTEELERQGTGDVSRAIALARQYLDLGAGMIMVESEGITESVRQWRADAVGRIVEALGLERVMFEAADTDVFTWYIKTYGPDVNLFVDASQIVQLAALRTGIWGTQDVWGRIASYKP